MLPRYFGENLEELLKLVPGTPIVDLVKVLQSAVRIDHLPVAEELTFLCDGVSCVVAE